MVSIFLGKYQNLLLKHSDKIDNDPGLKFLRNILVEMILHTGTVKSMKNNVHVILPGEECSDKGLDPDWYVELKFWNNAEQRKEQEYRFREEFKLAKDKKKKKSNKTLYQPSQSCLFKNTVKLPR